MKKFVVGLLVVVVVLVVGLLVAPSFIPVDTYKEQIAEAVRAKTGRDLDIQGDVSLSLLPTVAIEANDVTFSNAEWASQPYLGRLRRLVVDVQVLPLINGELKIDSFVLVEPEINLEISADGRRNWEFAATAPTAEPTAEDSAGGRAPAAEEAAWTGGTAGGGGAISALSLGDVRLENGVITFRDARSGEAYRFSDIDMSVRLPDLDSPFSADGQVTWNGRQVTLKVSGDKARDLLEGVETGVAVELASDLVTFSYKGRVTGGTPPTVLGDIDLTLPSVRALTEWTGKRFQPGGEFALPDAAYQVSGIQMKVSLPSMDGPFSAAGRVTWNGREVRLDVAGEGAESLLAGTPVPIAVKIGSDLIKLDYKGSLTYAEPLVVKGDIDLDVASVRELASWTGNPIEPGGGLGPLAIRGKISAEGQRYAFDDAAISLDGMNGQGSLLVDLRRRKPYLRGQLSVDRIDLNTYAAAAPASAGGGQATAPAPAPAPRRSGWSTEPVDVSALKTADADFGLAVGAIQVKNVRIGKTALTLALRGGLLTLDLQEVNLYGGGGKGRIVVDGRGEVPSIRSSLLLDGIEALPLLTDAAGFDRLEGRGRIEVAVSARGRSQMDMVQNLNGNGSIRFVDGAIRGINLAAMVRNVSSAFLDSGARQAQKTDFAELSGTFTIRNGVLTNNDLVLLNPLLRVTGSGNVFIPPRTVKYRIVPKVVASLQGQGASADDKGIAVPVVVKGPWDNLSFQPDLSSVVEDIAKDPSKVIDTVKEVGKGGIGGGFGKILEGITGQGGGQPLQGGQQQGGQGGAIDPGKLLKGLFGN